MKLILRLIGFAVVLLVLTAALLYFLNEKGVLKGALSEWVTSVKNDIMHMFGSTKDMVNDIKDSDTPLQDNINNPLDLPKKETPQPDLTPAPEP